MEVGEPTDVVDHHNTFKNKEKLNLKKIRIMSDIPTQYQLYQEQIKYLRDQNAELVEKIKHLESKIETLEIQQYKYEEKIIGE